MNDAFILNCPNYVRYLERYVTVGDTRYLRNIPVSRMLVQLNYRSNFRLYTKKEFLRRKKQLWEQLSSGRRRTFLLSWGFQANDPVLQELASREKPNKQKMLSTIIHLRSFNKNGFEISGFIDYAESLNQDYVDWAAVFEGRKILRPKPTDLSYLDWHVGRVHFNNTANYVIEHDVNGLIFMHRGDHKKLYVDKCEKLKENGYSRSIVCSDLYGYVIFYDHVIRNKI